MAIEDDDPFASLGGDPEGSSDNPEQNNNEETSQGDDPFASENQGNDAEPFASTSQESDDPFASVNQGKGTLPNDLGSARGDDTHLGGTEADDDHEEDEGDPFDHFADDHDHHYADVEPEGLGGVEDDDDLDDDDDPIDLLEKNPVGAGGVGTTGFMVDEPDPHADQTGSNEYYPTENEPRVDPFDSLMENLKKGQDFMNEFQNRQNAILNMQTSTSTESMPSTAPAASGHAPKLQSYITALGKKLFAPEKERFKVDEDEQQEVIKKLAYLEKRIQQTKDTYRGYERKSKNWALFFRMLSSSLAAIVTVLLGINITDYLRSLGVDWFINTTALVISAFISIIGVIQGFFETERLYIKYTDTGNKLDQLQALLEYLKLGGDYVSLADINLVKLEYDRIIENTHNYEMQVRADDDEVSSRILRQGNEDDN